MPILSGTVSVVTGAGRGIGRATAELFAAEGSHVVLVARTQSQLDDAVAVIAASGGSATPLAGDVTDESFVARAFAEVEERFDRLDILVNNAGIGRFGPVEEADVADLRETLEVNVVGPFLCMQQAVRLMKRTGGGKIINVGSVRSHWTESGDAGFYNASKYALRGMTESVARQLHGTKSNISVGLVCPGVVDTTLTNPGREARPDWLTPRTVAASILHAATAPPNANVFDVTVFSTEQAPW